MKTKVVAIRLTESEFCSLKNKASHNNVTMTDYIHDALFPKLPHVLTVERILGRIEELKKSGRLNTGDITTIQELFAEEEYIQYFNVIPIGRTFAGMTQNDKTTVYATVQLIPHTKPAKYKIK